MKDRSKVIFGNVVSASVLRRAQTKKNAYIKKYGDDSSASYQFSVQSNPVLTRMLGTNVLALDKSGEAFDPDKAVIVGNIRMGFGHYRIAMAIASAARFKGYQPYWLDFVSLQQTTASKVISHLNNLYSLGSRLSQRFSWFNKFYWEPLNYTGFKRLSFNSADQKVAELFASVCKNFPKDMPFFGTHVWPAQAAVHAGMQNVVNIIPDNWPMALHLAEGSLHVVQSPSAYMGYRMLREMDETKQTLNPIPASQLEYVGHFVDHEIVSNIDKDCDLRLNRLKQKKARRVLLTVGGAGAQRDFFVGLLKALLPMARAGKITLFLNFGDHKKLWEEICASVSDLATSAVRHFNNWEESHEFARAAIEGEVSGVHAFCDSDIFAAVYLTNVLMRATDVMITKPSELAYYPVPKLFIKRVGGHEMWGAIRGAELGDGSIECENLPFALQALSLMVEETDLLSVQIDSIVRLNKAGMYNGAYRAVELALDRR